MLESLFPLFRCNFLVRRRWFCLVLTKGVCGVCCWFGVLDFILDLAFIFNKFLVIKKKKKKKNLNTKFDYLIVVPAKLYNIDLLFTICLYIRCIIE